MFHALAEQLDIVKGIKMSPEELRVIKIIISKFKEHNAQVSMLSHNKCIKCYEKIYGKNLQFKFLMENSNLVRQ